MPRTSIIIAAWNIENFIEQCLHSCLHHDPSVYEVIVVDDASSDRTVQLTERFIAEHAGKINIRLIRKPVNEGLGLARNTGMDAATGEFLLFLDGDDWFADGFLQRIQDVLEARDPDVVMFSHARVYGSGKMDLNTMRKLLVERPEYPVEVRRALVDNFGVAWNKAYRLSFLRERGFRFEKGLYEDINWSFPIILTAPRLYTIQDTGVNYRQRVGSILRSTSPEHFDALHQLRRLLETVRTNPDLAKNYGMQLYRYARRQAFFVVEQGRVPADLIPRYITEAFAQILEWRYALSIQSRDLALSAFQKFGYRGYAAFKTLRESRLVRISQKTMRAMRGWVKGKAQKLTRYLRMQRWRTKAIASRYAKQLESLPIDENKVVFDSYWGAKADCNPLAIARALDRNGGFDLVWFLKKGAYVPADLPGRIVERGSPEMFHEAATAKYFVSNVNFPGEIIKRPGSVHLQTFHGTPLKLMGIDIRTRNPKEMNWDHFVERSLRWDYAISSNPHSSYAWRRSHPFYYKILEVGYPRNDIFFNATEADRERIRIRLGVQPGKKVALYAPTMRDDLKGRKLAISHEIFDADEVAQALGDEYVLLVRAHYFLCNTDSSASQAIDVSAYPDSNEIALISDLLITDYSSLMFDFACLRRPIILYQYDHEEYLVRRGVYFDIRDIPPGPIVQTREELREILISRAFEAENSLKQIQAFADRFAPWDDGKATQRVIAQVFGLGPRD